MPASADPPLHLSDDEQAALRRWLQDPDVSEAIQRRARIILRCADGGGLREIADDLGVRPETVTRWRRRFVTRRLAGLRDDPRSGRPKVITEEQAHRLQTTLATLPPDGQRRWSTRSLARATGLSQSAVSRILRTLQLQPVTVGGWRLTGAASHAPSVRGLIGLCLGLPMDALVLCAHAPGLTPTGGAGTTPAGRHGDVRTTARDGARLDLPLLVERLRRRAELSWATEDGLPDDECFLDFLKTVDRTAPPDTLLYLVVDDPLAFGGVTVRDWLLRHPHLRPHLCPTPGTWRHLLRCWVEELGRREQAHCPGHGLDGLDAALADRDHGEARPFVWVRPAGDRRTTDSPPIPFH